MNPISRLRTRARSLAGRSATAWPFRKYSPLLAESSRPRIDRRVDLPHPDGPPMDTYSPFATSRLTSDSACVSTSSVRKTLATDFNLMTLFPLADVMMPSHLVRNGPAEAGPHVLGLHVLGLFGRYVPQATEVERDRTHPRR